MAQRKKPVAESPRGKRTSAAGFSALALLSGEGRPGSPLASDTSNAHPKKAPKKRAAKAPPPPPVATATVSGRPKPTQQRGATDLVSFFLALARRRRRRLSPFVARSPAVGAVARFFQNPNPIALANPRSPSTRTNSINNNNQKPAAGSSVRVWWPPTRDPEKTGFAGAFWPAKVAAGPSGGAAGAEWTTVRYDNGEKARAFADDLYPSDQPVDFGAEREPLRPGEFVEVHNGSASDPCAWFGLARKVSLRTGGEASVAYPMHDSPAETVPLGRVRRVRVWEGGGWRLPRPGQRWQPGEVTSPRELELVPEKEYVRRYVGGSSSSANGGGGGAGGEAGAGGSKAAAAAPKKAAAAPKSAAAPKAAPKAAKKPEPKKQAAPATAPAGKRPVGRPKKASK
jgi:hypothetical protein